MANEKKRRKVLFFTAGSVGGAERVTVTIAKMLPSDKFDVRFVFVSKNGEEDLAPFIPKKYPIEKISFRNIWLFTILRMLRLIKKEKPDVLFSSLGFLNWRLCIISKFLKGTKLIIRSDNMPGAFQPQDFFFIKYFYKDADEIIFQTEEMRDAFRSALKGVDENKLRVITNPIDIDTINSNISRAVNPYYGKHKEILYVGRISREKGLDFLIPVFKDLAMAIPDIRLTIVGKISDSNTYYKEMKALIQQLKLEDKVQFVGFQSNPYKWIKFANCFVLPSRIEGLPNVVREAVYLNTPVVATRSVPVVERIIPSGRGYVINVDDKEALKECIIKCLNMHIETPYEYKADDFEQVFEC